MFKKIIVPAFGIITLVTISAVIAIGIIIGSTAVMKQVLTSVPEDIGRFLENTNTATVSHEITVDTYGDLAIFVLSRIDSEAKSGLFARYFYLKELRQIGEIDPVIEILKTHGYDIEIEQGYIIVSWYDK
jgi:hypothetical protein